MLRVLIVVLEMIREHSLYPRFQVFHGEFNVLLRILNRLKKELLLLDVQTLAFLK
jgi:hypothetical protein